MLLNPDRHLNAGIIKSNNFTMEANKIKVHIVGGGNLGVALAIGLSKFCSDAAVTVTRRNVEQIRFWKNSECRYLQTIILKSTRPIL